LVLPTLGSSAQVWRSVEPVTACETVFDPLAPRYVYPELDVSHAVSEIVSLSPWAQIECQTPPTSHDPLLKTIQEHPRVLLANCRDIAEWRLGAELAR
jgi:hypothetical protein